MRRPREDTKQTTGLSGAALEAAVLDIAWRHPDLVALGEADASGRVVRIYPQVVERPGPLPRGAGAAIDPRELRERWAAAVDDLRRHHQRITLQAVATRLGVSPKTAGRYRDRYGLQLG